MKFRKTGLPYILAGVLLASGLGLIGCMGVPKDPYGLVDPYESDPTDAATNNNSFSQATKVALNSNSATFSAVLTLHDVDVYNLGPAAGGDTLIVDVDIPDRVLLNAAVGIFDSVGRVFYLNEEDTQIAPAPLTDVKFPAWAPHFEFTVYQATSPLYLAVASLAEPTGTAAGGSAGYTGGPYTVTVAFQRGGPIPQPVKQVVALQFDDSVVDYPPMEAFGNWADPSPAAFTGMNGRVLDPGWWRPFTIMQVEMLAEQNNLQFWTAFLTFANASGVAIPNLANVTPQQVYGLLLEELLGLPRYAGQPPWAVLVASANPGGFTPANLQWFLNNNFPWLYTFGMYLGTGFVAQGGPAGLNIYNAILAAGYPTAQDPTYDDFINITDTIKTKIEEVYAGLNIEFLAVGVDPIPTNVPVESLYLVSNADGTGLLGLSSTLDMGNQNHSDFAAIFAGEQGYYNALLLGIGNPEGTAVPDEVISVLAVTAAHELGHTLGLVHTDSTTDLMKRTGGGLSDLTATFSTAPLDSSMFPIGMQDSYLLLLLALGLQ
jgi:hypothetical protein